MREVGKQNKGNKMMVAVLLILCLSLQPLQGSGITVHASNNKATNQTTSKIATESTVKAATKASKEITLSKPTTTK